MQHLSWSSRTDLSGIQFTILRVLESLIPKDRKNITTLRWSKATFYITTQHLPPTVCYLELTNTVQVSYEETWLWPYEGFKHTVSQLRGRLLSDSMAELLTHQTSNFRIASRMGSNPVRGKLLFLWVKNFTLIAQFWLVPEMDSRVCL